MDESLKCCGCIRFYSDNYNGVPYCHGLFSLDGKCRFGGIFPKIADRDTANRWIFVDDNLPEFGVVVRVLREGHPCNEFLAFRVNMTHKGKAVWFLDNGVEVSDVTHWVYIEKKCFFKAYFEDGEPIIEFVGDDVCGRRFQLTYLENSPESLQSLAIWLNRMMGSL